MDFEALSIPAVVLVSLTGVFLILGRDWRLSIIALVIQYFSVFVLVSISWVLEMAAVKLVAGWMAGAVLGMALIGTPERSPEGRSIVLSSVLFRLLVAGLVGLLVVSMAPRMAPWVPGITREQLYGGLILIGMGLLHLALTSEPLRVILGLLTVLAGFEILYAAVETSALVSGLLAGVNLGLALVGAYLLAVPTLEEA